LHAVSWDWLSITLEHGTLCRQQIDEVKNETHPKEELLIIDFNDLVMI